jgi:hypothetical protein
MKLSPSKLSVLRDCPRCFWWENVKKLPRPRGIFPSLPGGMDRALKRHVENEIAEGRRDDTYHLDGLKNAAFFADRARMKQWQNNFRGLRCMVGDVELHGAIDDLVQWPNGDVSPYDFKTRGAAPKEGQSDVYYGTQLDCYHLLLEKDAGLHCNGTGYLRYGWPLDVMARTVEFEWQTVGLTTNPDRAARVVEEAERVLKMLEPPDYPMSCEYCTFIAEREKLTTTGG